MSMVKPTSRGGTVGVCFDKRTSVYLNKSYSGLAVPSSARDEIERALPSARILEQYPDRWVISCETNPEDWPAWTDVSFGLGPPPPDDGS